MRWRGPQQAFSAGVKLWLGLRSRRYELIIKEFVVEKDDFGGFLKFRGFREIFGRISGSINADSLGVPWMDRSLQ